MNIIPRKPFGELDNFFQDDEWFFPVFSKKAFDPEMDVYETEKEIIAELSIPDFKSEDVKVSLEDGMLKVSGEFKEEQEDKKKGKSYWKKEIRKGSFQRIIRVPVDVDEEKIDAVYEKGLLKVVLPKTEQKKKKGKDVKIRTK